MPKNTFTRFWKDFEIDYENITVIKELEDDFEVVYLRTTTIESTLYPFWYQASNPLRKATTFNMGSIFEDVIVTSLISREAGEILSERYADQLKNSHWMVDSSSKDLEYLIYKLENDVMVDIVDEYYRDKVISTNWPMTRPIACGKYLVILTWTKDLTLGNGKIVDLKYYWSKFWDKDKTEYDVYTLENFRDSNLYGKTQRYTYCWLDWVTHFSYHLFPKTKNAPSKKNPNNHLKQYVYDCEVDLDLAEKEIKSNIIEYFKIAQYYWWELWSTIQRSEAAYWPLSAFDSN